MVGSAVSGGIGWKGYACREWGLYDKWVAGEVGLLEETEWVRRVKKKMIKTESSKWRRELEECSKKGGKLELYGKVKEEWGMEKDLLEGRSWREMMPYQ